MHLFETYLLIALGLFGLWTARRRLGDGRSGLSRAEADLNDFARRLRSFAAWATLSAGLLQIVADYGSPFDFFAAPLGPIVATAWAVILAPILYVLVWTCFVAEPEQLDLVIQRTLKRPMPRRLQKVVLMLFGGTALVLFVFVWRTNPTAADPAPARLLPETTGEFIGAALLTALLFGGLFGGTYRQEALDCLADPAKADPKKAARFFSTRREYFVGGGWQLMQRARLLSALVVVIWVFLAAIALTRHS